MRGPLPQHGMGSWLAVRDPRHSFGVSASHSPGAAARAAAIARRVVPRLPACGRGALGLGTAGPAALASPGRDQAPAREEPQRSRRAETRPEPTGSPLQDRGQGDLCMVQRRLISGPGPFLSTTAPGNPVAVRHICNQDF